MAIDFISDFSCNITVCSLISFPSKLNRTRMISTETSVQVGGEKNLLGGFADFSLAI